MAVLGALLGVLAVACGPGSDLDRSAASAVIRPAGCPAPATVEIEDGPHGTPVEQAQPRERTATVAHHAAAARVDLPEAVRRVRGLFDGSELVASHTLSSSGIHVELHSDGPLRLHPADLEETFRAPFQPEAVGDPELRAVLACYEDRIVGSRELDGVRVRILVPSDPRVCLHRLVLGLDAPPGTPCRSGGVTLPAVDLSIGGVVQLGGSGLIILAPAAVDADPQQPSRALTRILVHELVHLYDNTMGLFPRPGELVAYEQRAHYIEAQVMSWYAGSGREVPRPLRYPGR